MLHIEKRSFGKYVKRRSEGEMIILRLLRDIILVVPWCVPLVMR